MTREDEFHQKLSDLITEYQDITAHGMDCECGCEYEGFDSGAPKVLLGHVLVLNLESIEGYSQLYWTFPKTQNYYMTLGMLQKAAESI